MEKPWWSWADIEMWSSALTPCLLPVTPHSVPKNPWKCLLHEGMDNKKKWHALHPSYMPDDILSTLHVLWAQPCHGLTRMPSSWAVAITTCVTRGVPSLSIRGTRCSGAYFDSSLFILASSLSPSAVEKNILHSIFYEKWLQNCHFIKKNKIFKLTINILL